jgi:hypothetical protein
VTSATKVEVAKPTFTDVPDEELEYQGYGSLVDWAVWSEGVLTVETFYGNSYDYDDPDASLFRGLEAADSDGAFFNANLKGKEKK